MRGGESSDTCHMRLLLCIRQQRCSGWRVFCSCICKATIVAALVVAYMLCCRATFAIMTRRCLYSSSWNPCTISFMRGHAAARSWREFRVRHCRRLQSLRHVVQDICKQPHQGTTATTSDAHWVVP
jgi:hypothetical protein